MENNFKNSSETLNIQILNEGKKIETELKRETKLLKKLNRRSIIIIALLAIALISGAIIAFAIFGQNKVYTDQAEISAPVIDLAPEQSGTLNEVFVQQGDEIEANTIVARIGNELIKSKVAGIVVSVKLDIGKIFNRGEAIVSMIEPDQLRVLGKIEEDKGLKDISVGQQVRFTVDAFGNRDFWGIVDEVSPTSRSSDVIFSISDKRQSKKFNVYIRFNVSQYPELKNGMSARMWIYKR